MASWWTQLTKNTINAKSVAKGVKKAFRAKVPRGNIATFMGVGAGIGAGRGLLDNVIGEDRVSVLGGAVQGATVGAGLYGGRSLFRAGWASRASRSRVGRRAGRTVGNIINTSPGSTGGGMPSFAGEARRRATMAAVRRGTLL